MLCARRSRRLPEKLSFCNPFSQFCIKGKFFKDRDCEEERRAPMSRVVFRPEAPAVGFDDGATDGKPHAQPVPFGREKRLKNPVELIAGQSRSVVPNGNF